MTNRTVKVKREMLTACMTCPVCKKLLREATTISRCLHTFCRKCIDKKLSDEEMDCCPVCKINLGGTPLEKLRPDHTLQDLRGKIFPLKRKNVDEPESEPKPEPEVAARVALPAKRKEISISSLVANTPKVSTQAIMTGRRTKKIARKAANLRGSSFSNGKAVRNDEKSEDDHLKGSSSPETIKKFTFSQSMRQTSSRAESSQSMSNNGKGIASQPCDGKLDLLEPLHYLVEAANRSKSLKSNLQGSDAKLEHACISDNEAQDRRTKVKGKKFQLNVGDEKNSSDPVSSGATKEKKIRRVHRKRKEPLSEAVISPQAVVDANHGRHERRTGPIWFSLIASQEQDGGAALPQVPARYLRIKDGNMPVSFIQKYLMKKLDLTSEAEVEIKCMGEPVLPTLQLQNVVDMMSQSPLASLRVPVSVGSSAKDFTMVLAYSRKLQNS